MAIRSNTKEAKAAIREYIKDTLVLRSDEFTRFDASGTLEDTCRAYVDYIDEIMRNDHVCKGTANHIRHDLDGGGAWEVYTYERAKLVGSWLHQTEEEIDRYYERGMCDETFRNLIVREIMQLAGRY